MHTRYSEKGSGTPALLMMPGWCSTSSVFEHLGESLAQRHRTVEIDWPGHGGAPHPARDFGVDELISEAVAIASNIDAEEVVPVAVSHAGWIAIELKRRLPGLVRRLVLVDWIILDPPPPFLQALEALQSEHSWPQVRDALFAMWSGNPPDEAVAEFLRRDMAGFEYEMWKRAGREIAQSYATYGSPLAALAALPDPPQVHHIYAQPGDQAYLEAQQLFAAQHSWFSVGRLEADTHFPTIEVPKAVASEIERFISGFAVNAAGTSVNDPG